MPLNISILLLIIGLIIQIFDKMSERYRESIEKIPFLKTGLFWLSLLIILIGGYGTICSMLQAQKHKVYAAPSEIRLGHQRNKSFTLKITNNQNFAIFNVNVGICWNNKKFDQNLISINPVKGVEIPRVLTQLFRVYFTNACSALVISDINAHSTKEYFVRIQGEGLKSDSLISFVVYDWAPEPFSFDFPITKDQFAESPKNFEDYFKEKSEEEQKTGRAFIDKFKAPTNPYFQN